jgi:hypothetical protein
MRVGLSHKDNLREMKLTIPRAKVVNDKYSFTTMSALSV